jgi:hypothetical protein
MKLDAKTDMTVLAVAVAKLQVKTLDDLHYAHHERSAGSHKYVDALARLRPVVMANLSIQYENVGFRHRDNVSPKTWDSYFDKADDVKRDALKRYEGIFGKRFPLPKIPGDRPVARAARNSADTISNLRNDILSLRFAMDFSVLDHYKNGIGRTWNDRSVKTDEYFYEALDYLHQKEVYAWTSLLMFTAMLGGSLHAETVKMAANTFLGADDDREHIQMAVMNHLTRNMNQPSSYPTEEDENFRKDIKKAVSEL